MNLKHLVSRSIVKSLELRAFISSACRTELQHNDSPNLDALEQRIMLSASPMAVVADASVVDPVQCPEDARAEAGDSQNDAQAQTISNIVFVDASIEDYQQLVDGIGEEAGDTDVVLIDSQSDGIDQITEYLAQHTGIESVHIVSHGSDGEVRLGNTALNADTLDRYAGQIATWNGSLTSSADILFYGCDLAATEQGQFLVEAVGELTGADVAASEDLTGHESLGGDWDFEYSIGLIEAEVAFSDAIQASYLGTFATVSVNSTVDSVTGDTSSIANLIANDGGDGISLREAVIAANNTAGDDEITLGAGTFTFSLAGAGEDLSATGDLDVRGNLTISGDDQNTTIIDANNLDRVFDVTGADFNLQNVTVTGGVSAEGGGVRLIGPVDTGSFVATDVTITGNTADFGGGIANVGQELILSGVTISANSATNDGGGIYDNGGAAPTTITQSVVYGNDSDFVGAGIYALGGALDITNTTIANNSAITSGGGLAVFGTQTSLSHTTVSGNRGGNEGGGAFVSSGVVTVENSIIADNVAILAIEVSGTINSLGYNIIGNDAGDSAGGSGYDASDSRDETALALGALADNGGRIRTQELLAGSAGINDGTNTGQTTDARGYTRDDGLVDIGAFERGATPFEGPEDLSSGIELNTDGGNDAFFQAVTADPVFGGATELTVEISVQLDNAAGNAPHLVSYATATQEQEFNIYLGTTDLLSVSIGGQTFFGNSHAELRDGDLHQVSVSWDNSIGTITLYVDGILSSSGILPTRAGYALGPTGTLVIGQGQPSSGMTSTQAAEGTFYDVRVWDEVRSDAEIALNYRQKLSVGSLPASLIANWQFDGFNGSNEVTEVVGGANSLIVQHASGPTFTASTPVEDLNIDENSANGTTVGHVLAAHDDIGTTGTAGDFTYSLTDDANGRFAIDANTGKITVADGSLLNYETNTSHNVTVEVTDASGNTYSEGMSIVVNDVNEVPLLDLDANDSNGPGLSYEGTFVEDAGPVNITDSDAILSDVDSPTLSSVIASITNPLNGNFEVLAADTAGTTIDASYNVGTGVLTLTGLNGNESVADFEQVLRSITYVNNNNRPFTATRVIEIFASDGVNDSLVAESRIAIISVNDAPVLDNAGANTLTAINEDNSTSAGDTVASILASATSNPNPITDVDANPVEGIAVYTADATNGMWEYSTDGTNWIGFGTPSPSAALLLSEDALVRFVPDADFNGTAQFSYKAWDQTTGTEGGTLAMAANSGGTGTLSVAVDTATITVNAVNDSPEIAVNTGASTRIGGSVVITGGMLNEGDVDDAGAGLTYTVTGTANGRLEATGNPGTEITTFTQADVDAGDVTFVHDGLSDATGSFDYSLEDGGEDGAIQAAATFNVAIFGATPDSYTTDEDSSISHDATTGLLANDDAGLGGNPTVVVGLNAASDTDGNSTWTSEVGTLELALPFGVTYTTSPNNPPAGITAAFNFYGIGGATSGALDDLPEIDGTQSATLETWIYVDFLSGNNMIFDTGNNGQGGITLLTSGNSLVLAAAQGANIDTDFVPNGLTAGVWHHVALTLDMTSAIENVKVFVDGTEIASVSSSLVSWAPGPFGLGTTNGTTVGGYIGDLVGQIAHFRIHDQALDAATISSNAANPGGGSVMPFVAGFNDSATLGNVTVNSDGSFDYDPNGQFENLAVGETATDTFTYTYDDGLGNQEVASVVITVNGVNDASVVGGVNSGTVAEDGTLIDSGALTITDVDSSDNPVSWIDVASTAGDNGYGNFVMTGNTWTYMLDNANSAVQALGVGESLNDTYTFTATDGSTQTVAVTINGTNDAPTTSPVVLTAIAEDSGVRVITQAELLANASDVEGDLLTAAGLAISVGNGTLVDNGDGTWNYTPAADDDANVSFSYTVADATNNVTGTATLDITPVNDTPTATAPATLNATEQIGLPLVGAGFTIGDIDSDSSQIQLSFSVSEGGVVTDIGDSGVTVSNNLGTTTITGTVTEISALLAGTTTGDVTYQNNSDSPSSTATLTMTVNDLGNTGSDPGLTGDGTSEIVQTTTTINITSINDAPMIDLDADDSSGATGSGFQTTFTAGGGYQPIVDTADAILTDVDSPTLQSLTVQITNMLDGTDEGLDSTIGGLGLLESYDAATGTYVLTGPASVANFEQALRSLTYNNASTTPDLTPRVITITVFDGVNQSTAVSTTVSLIPDSTAPIGVNNSGITVDEGGQWNLDTLELSYTDSLQPNSSVTYTITAGPGSGYLASAGDTSTPITSFTQQQIDQGQVVYLHDGSELATDSFTFAVDDGAGNSLTGQVFKIAVSPVNDAPEFVTSPVAQTTQEDTALIFSSGNGNLISINDVDAAGADLEVTISVYNGQLTLDGTTGLSFTNGVGVSDTSMTFRGTVTEINAALDGLEYQPVSDYFGSDLLTVVINDLGNTGAGGPLVSNSATTIDVIPANDAPVMPADTSVTVAENTIAVGTFSGSDIDGDPLTYSLTGVDAGLFNINSVGEVSFASAPDTDAPADVNADNVYEITVVATDNGMTMLSDSQNVTVTVTDVNEFDVSTPIDSDATLNEVDENVAVGTTVGLTASAFDSDSTNNTVTYSLIGNPDGLFQIDANTGEVTTAAALNYEVHGATRTIVVEAASSDGSAATEAFTIAIRDLNEFGVGAVSDVDTSLNAIDEHTAIGTTVGITASASDADQTNNSITYQLQDDDGGRFQIDSVTGEVTVAANIDFETEGASRNITVRAQSSDGSFTDQVFTVEINDVNEAPTVAITGIVFSVSEDTDTTNGVRIADIVVTDDALGTNNLSLSGTDAGVFEIVGNELRLRSGANLDFELTTQYDVNVEVDDATLGTSPDDVASLTLNVSDADDDAPVVEPEQNFSVVESSNNGTSIGNVVAVDVDTTTSLGPWAIVGGNEDGNFAINPLTGAISVADNTNLDFEKSTSYALSIVVSNGNQVSEPELVAINVLDTNDAPVAQNDTYAVEQFDSVTVLGSGVLLNDVDQDGDSLTVSLISEPNHGILTLNPDGSVVYVPLGTFVGSDFFTYQVSDGRTAGNIATVEIVIEPVGGITGPGSPGGPAGSNDPTEPNTGAPIIPITLTTSSNPISLVVVTSAENTSEGNSKSFTQVVGQSGLESEFETESETESEPDSFPVELNANDSFSYKSRSANDLMDLDDRFKHLKKQAMLESGSLLASLPLSVVFPEHHEESEQSPVKNLDKMISGTYAITTASFSMGYVLWLVRGGSLLASFTSVLPVWTSMDPLSIVAVSEKDEEETDDESLLQIVDVNSGK